MAEKIKQQLNKWNVQYYGSLNKITRLSLCIVRCSYTLYTYLQSVSMVLSKIGHCTCRPTGNNDHMTAAAASFQHFTPIVGRQNICQLDCPRDSFIKNELKVTCFYNHLLVGFTCFMRVALTSEDSTTSLLLASNFTPNFIYEVGPTMVAPLPNIAASILSDDMIRR